MRSIHIVLGTLALALSLSANVAAADEVTTVRFVQDCLSSAEDCKLVVDEVDIDSDATCGPSVDQVITEIRRHVEWSGQPWQGSVQSAIGAICKQ